MRDMDLDTSKGHPDMDYREHVTTYKGFLRLAQFAVVFLVLLMVAMYVFLVPKA
ncbi:MAG: aa3-type cytochrome c oxidase subunit IV [Hyphomicrobium aestuarii]|nr:aa3-type cytochrome c oxidase subunit IV [Hyphomicrobium aestuarii]